MNQTFNSADLYSCLASTTIATGMKGTLGLMNLRDGNKIGLAGNVFNTEGIATLNGVVANAMAAGTESSRLSILMNWIMNTETI